MLCAIAVLFPRSHTEIWRRESLPAGEVQRYEAQYRLIQQICALYEEEPNDFGRLFTLIQEVRLTCLCSYSVCTKEGKSDRFVFGLDTHIFRQ